MGAEETIKRIHSILKGRIVRVCLDPDYEYTFMDDDGVTTFIDGEVEVAFTSNNTIATVCITDPGDESCFMIIPGNLVHAIISIPENEDTVKVLDEEDSIESVHHSERSYSCGKPGLVN